MHKILGYLLLCTGLFLIFFAGNGVYKTFIRQAPVAQIVKMGDITAHTTQGAITVPADGINTLANTVLFAVLMQLLVFAGAHVARLGIYLLKTERIYDALSQLDLTDKDDLKTLKKL
ncbi:hypothetical protein [Candidatus Avelusimicrobium faecicola]|uniref:hypothetical protein n=1 Tax=Candidatus Avelusimicrobium faecicola TaxID=3416205 RepID=UPI003D0FB278